VQLRLDRFQKADVAGVAANGWRPMGRPADARWPLIKVVLHPSLRPNFPLGQLTNARSWCSVLEPCAQRPKRSWIRGHRIACKRPEPRPPLDSDP